MKNRYSSPVLDLVELNIEDVIVTSDPFGSDLEDWVNQPS